MLGSVAILVQAFLVQGILQFTRFDPLIKSHGAQACARRPPEVSHTSSQVREREANVHY